MDDELPLVVGRPARLILCYGCGCHVARGTQTCPHCGGDVNAYTQARLAEIAAAKEEIARILADLGE